MLCEVLRTDDGRQRRESVTSRIRYRRRAVPRARRAQLVEGRASRTRGRLARCRPRPMPRRSEARPRHEEDESRPGVRPGVSRRPPWSPRTTVATRRGTHGVRWTVGVPRSGPSGGAAPVPREPPLGWTSTPPHPDLRVASRALGWSRPRQERAVPRRNYPRISPTALALVEQILEDAALHSDRPLPHELREAACPPPDPSLPLEFDETRLKRGPAVALGDRNETRHRLVPVEHGDCLASADTCDVAREIILQLGDPGLLHMAMIAMSLTRHKSDRAAAGCWLAPAIRRRQRARPAAAAPRIHIIPPPRRRSIFECLTKSFDVRLSGSPPPVVDRDRARLVADADDAHAHGPRRQQRLQPLGPLDDRDAVAVHHLLQTQVEQLGEALRAVDVHMMHGQPAAVLVHEHEGRTGGAGRDAERADEALHEDCLAGAELAADRDDVAGSQRRAQPLSRGVGLLGRARDEPSAHPRA